MPLQGLHCACSISLSLGVSSLLSSPPHMALPQGLLHSSLHQLLFCTETTPSDACSEEGRAGQGPLAHFPPQGVLQIEWQETPGGLCFAPTQRISWRDHFLQQFFSHGLRGKHLTFLRPFQILRRFPEFSSRVPR